MEFKRNAGTSSREDRQQGRRSLRVRRARPAYAECSDLDEPEETGGRRHEHPTAAPAPVAAAEPQSRSNVQLQPPVQARQGYMPSAAQPAPTPGAWAFLDGERCPIGIAISPDARPSHVHYRFTPMKGRIAMHTRLLWLSATVRNGLDCEDRSDLIQICSRSDNMHVINVIRYMPTQHTYLDEMTLLCYAVTPEEATRKPTPFSPGVVTVRNDKLEWEAGGTPSVGLLNFVTGKLAPLPLELLLV